MVALSAPARVANDHPGHAILATLTDRLQDGFGIDHTTIGASTGASGRRRRMPDRIHGVLVALVQALTARTLADLPPTGARA